MLTLGFPLVLGAEHAGITVSVVRVGADAAVLSGGTRAPVAAVMASSTYVPVAPRFRTAVITG